VPLLQQSNNHAFACLTSVSIFFLIFKVDFGRDEFSITGVTRGLIHGSKLAKGGPPANAQKKIQA